MLKKINEFYNYIKQEKLYTVIILSFGIALSGYFIGSGIYNSSNKRTVTVKGLAEKIVKSDTAIWNIKINNIGNNLTQLQIKTDNDIKLIKNFLQDAGFKQNEIQDMRVNVRDKNAYSSNIDNKNRFVIETGVTIQTNNIELIDSTSRKMGYLIKKGIQITEDYQGPIYIFSGLNDIKIEMIKTATQNAKKAGEQFANDTSAKLCDIMRANQGVFTIESVNNDSGYYSENDTKSIDKKIRTVSTITFYLK